MLAWGWSRKGPKHVAIVGCWWLYMLLCSDGINHLILFEKHIILVIHVAVSHWRTLQNTRLIKEEITLMRSLKLLLCHQLSVLVPCFLCSYLEQCPPSLMWLSPLRLNSHRINHLQWSSVMHTWGVQTYFNVLSTPHRWSWQLERRRK